MRRLSLKSTLFGVDPIFVGELLEKLPTKRQFWQFLGERAFRRKWLEYWLCAASHPRKPRGYWVWREMQKQKKPQVFELAAFKVAGWALCRIGLRFACPSGFCSAKIPFESRHILPQKTQPLRIAFLKVAGWTRCRRSCISILITRIYFQ